MSGEERERSRPRDEVATVADTAVFLELLKPLWDAPIGDTGMAPTFDPDPDPDPEE
jgi:hypothetical protein